MEKRNYVTVGRTVETSEDMIDSAVKLFGTEKKTSDEFVKRASVEDEESDRGG